jgi:membrane protein implicated in regulation of membrane protease activity
LKPTWRDHWIIDVSIVLIAVIQLAAWWNGFVTVTILVLLFAFVAWRLLRRLSRGRAPPGPPENSN